MADKKVLLLIEIREDGARVVKRMIGDIGDTGNQVTNQMGKLKTMLAGLVSAKVLRDTIMLADGYANMLNRLRVVTDGTWELNAAMTAVHKMSRETRTSLLGNIDMYSRIAINTKRMGLQMKDVVRFATQLNHAIILSGVTAREAQWGMVQFSQGLAAGALRGDELRAVMEQLPIVTQTLTKYLGIGRGELRKWAFEGRVTTRVIIDAFNDAEKSLEQRFGKRIPTVDQSLTVLDNSLTAFIGNMDQAIQGTGSLALALLWVGDNMDQFGRILILVATALGSLLLVNLYKTLVGMKLFNFAWLTSIKRMTMFKIGLVGLAFALVVYSDKIKIANNSTATLADFMKALGQNALDTYKIMRDGLSGLFDGGAAQKEYAVTFETILLDAAKFTDKFIGFFVGAGQVIKKVILELPTYGRKAWNAFISGLEYVTDVVRALFLTLGSVLLIFAINTKTAMVSLGGAIDQALRGNAEQAKKFANQMVHSFKQSFTMGFENFGDILARNLEEGASEESFAPAKVAVESAGETLGEAFKRGFGMSNVITEGVEDLLERAKARGVGGADKDKENLFNPTPTQLRMIKEMIGDVGSVNSKMTQLKELWAAINEGQPGTEGFAVTLDHISRKMTELKVKALEFQTDAMGGFKKGFLQLGLEISNFADMANKAIVNAFGGMEDALVSLVTTGKIDFKSMVDSMLADLTRLIARMLFMKALEDMAGGAGGGWGKAFAGAFGVKSGTEGTPEIPTPGGKGANGGYMSPGVDYLVGEQGRAELFRPSKPGHLAPVESQSRPTDQGGGGVVIINVSSEEEAIAAMNSHQGKRIIRNEIRTYSSGSGQ